MSLRTVRRVVLSGMAALVMTLDCIEEHAPPLPPPAKAAKSDACGLEAVEI